MRTYSAEFKRRTGEMLWSQYRGAGARSGSWISKSRRLAIYERDGWLCWICGELTEPTDDWNANRAPSLDHRTPVSLGGDNSDANLSCAHRACNSRRGATYPMEVLAA